MSKKKDKKYKENEMSWKQGTSGAFTPEEPKRRPSVIMPDYEKGMGILNKNLRNDATASQTDNNSSSDAGSTSGAAQCGESLKNREGKVMTNKQIREMLNKLDHMALDEGLRYCDLVNSFDALTFKEALDNDEKRAITQAARESTRTGDLSIITNTIEEITANQNADPRARLQQAKAQKEAEAAQQAPQASVQEELEYEWYKDDWVDEDTMHIMFKDYVGSGINPRTGEVYKPDEFDDFAGHYNTREKVQESYDIEDLNRIFEEEEGRAGQVLTEGRHDLEPRKCVSIETHTVYWSPWDKKEKDYAKFGIRYRYEDRESCLEAINDPDNDLGYEDKAKKKKDAERDEEPELLAASYQRPILSTTINESVMVHVDGDNIEREFDNIQQAEDFAKSTGKKYKIYQADGDVINDIDDVDESLNESEGDTTTSKLGQEMVNGAAEYILATEPEMLQVNSKIVKEFIGADLQPHDPRKKKSNFLTIDDLRAPLTDVLILMTIYENTDKGRTLNKGLTRLELAELMYNQKGAKSSAKNSKYITDLVHDDPPLIRVGYFQNEGTPDEEFIDLKYNDNGETTWNRSGIESKIYPTTYLANWIETDHVCTQPDGTPIMTRVDSTSNNMVPLVVNLEKYMEHGDYQLLKANLAKKPSQTDRTSSDPSRSTMSSRKQPAAIAAGKAEAAANSRLAVLADKANKVNATAGTSDALSKSAEDRLLDRAQMFKDAANAHEEDSVEGDDTGYSIPTVDTKPQGRVFSNSDEEEEEEEFEESFINEIRERHDAKVLKELDEILNEEKLSVDEQIRNEYKRLIGVDNDYELTRSDIRESAVNKLCALHNWVPSHVVEAILGR